MLTKICNYLKNFFETERIIGDVVISEGKVSVNGNAVEIAKDAYFALFHQHFVTGVFKYGTDELADGSFRGAVWLMDIPKAIFDAAEWGEAWNAQHGNADSQANTPFDSESFGGYAYTKAQSSTSANGSSVFNNAQFIAMILPYRRIRL